jgi:hypothetical protein
MSLSSLETASFWFNVAVVVFTVAAAVAGIFALYFSLKLGALKDQDFDKFKSESATQLSLANARSAEANKISESLRLEVSRANERTAMAQRSAADARLETERLRQKIAWRRLSSEQRAILISSLRGHPDIEIWVGSVKNDPECNLYWQEIVAALKAAGLKVVAHTAYAMGTGLTINQPSNPNSNVFKEAFRKAGIPLDDSSGDSERRKFLEIVVGSKPEPF